jgi:hypothetical protein
MANCNICKSASGSSSTKSTSALNKNLRHHSLFVKVLCMQFVMVFAWAIRMTSCHMSRQRVTQKNIWCRLREAHLGSLLTTQVSALSDLLRITSVLIFTPPVPYTRDQTPEDNGLGKFTFLATGAKQYHCPFYQKKGGLLSLARGWISIQVCSPCGAFSQCV